MHDMVKRLYWFISSEIGFDARKFIRFFAGLPRYVRDWCRFRRVYAGRISIFPCLQDWHEGGGTASGEYFLQDLYVAQQIFAAAPQRHVDIGSRIDGFAAHVASFREIEVFDIRPVDSKVPGVVFRQADLMDADALPPAYCDSLSCLHALEHFGLGRYGDPLNPEGHLQGLRNMAGLLKPGGRFYLSGPVGVPRVQFNAQRIMDPRKLVRAAGEFGLTLVGMASMRPGGELHEAQDTDAAIAELEQQPYALGIFIFEKQEN